MKRILVIYDGTVYTYRWLSTLLWSKDVFKGLGYKICIPGIFHSIKTNKSLEYWRKQIRKDDIVLLAFHAGGYYFNDLDSVERLKMVSYVKSLKELCYKLIWLDTTDSAGTTFFEVLPYVDKYLKKQLYVDYELYNKDLCRDRLFCEYYSNREDAVVSDIDIPHNTKLNKEYSYKLGLSWNVGLGSLFVRSKIRFLLDLDRKHESILFFPPSIDKKYDVFYRGSAYNSITGYQRKLAIKVISTLNCKHPDPRIRVSQSVYDDEIKDSKAILSPFGWGEICTRDFETFRNGALLIKPDMSHMITYPNWFKDNETYISVDWDFSNIEERLALGLEDSNYSHITNTAQKLYKYHLSNSGKTEFVNHLLKELQEV